MSMTTSDGYDDDAGETQPDLPADLAVDYAAFGARRSSLSPMQWFPPELRPQSWQECRICHTELIGPNTATAVGLKAGEGPYGHTLGHAQFRHLGEHCRQDIIRGTEALAKALRVDKWRLLDVILTFGRNFDAEQRLEQQTYARITPRPQPAQGTQPPQQQQRRHV